MMIQLKKRFSYLVFATAFFAPTTYVAAQSEAPTGSGIIELEEGELPGYDALRLTSGKPSELQRFFLESIPTISNDVVTSAIVFPEVSAESSYYRLNLKDLVNLALEGNFDLQNSRRNVIIARSSVRSAEAEFIPFVDLVASSSYQKGRVEDATRTETSEINGEIVSTNVDTVSENAVFRNQAGIESGVTLPSGARLNLDATNTISETRDSDGGSSTSRESDYAGDVEIRLIQPLLRGAGPTVQQASLRQARISEMNSIINHSLRERDVVLDVISTYFNILQAARQLQVSREAITERLRFLDETRIKFNVGREDESKILNAEVQYLSELETAIGRRRDLDNQKETMLILLGLPLDTEISFLDITEELSDLGRVDIPDPNLAMQEALANRLELMQADLDLASQRLSNQLAVNDLLPDLDLQAGYGRSDNGPTIGDANEYERNQWNVGVAGRIPLINIQRREAARRSGLQLQNTEVQREQIERSLTREVLRAHRGVLATEAQLTILKKNVEQARRSLELVNARFEVGFETSVQVRLTQDDLFNAETRLSNTLLNYQIQLANLYTALGRPLR